MNTFEINQTLISNLKNVCFIGTFARDRLPIIKRTPSALIMNNDTSFQPGSHWIAMYIGSDGRGIYYDSFGLPPLFREIIEFMNKNCPNGWIYSNQQIQSVTSDTCGHFCILFIIMICNGFNLDEIMSLFTNIPAVNELLIKLYAQ